jgi:hypothetical protein
MVHFLETAVEMLQRSKARTGTYLRDIQVGGIEKRAGCLQAHIAQQVGRREPGHGLYLSIELYAAEMNALRHLLHAERRVGQLAVNDFMQALQKVGSPSLACGRPATSPS